VSESDQDFMEQAAQYLRSGHMAPRPPPPPPPPPEPPPEPPPPRAHFLDPRNFPYASALMPFSTLWSWKKGDK